MGQTFEYPAGPKRMFLVGLAAPENLVSTAIPFLHHQRKSLYDRKEPQLARATFKNQTENSYVN